MHHFHNRHKSQQMQQLGSSSDINADTGASSSAAAAAAGNPSTSQHGQGPNTAYRENRASQNSAESMAEQGGGGGGSGRSGRSVKRGRSLFRPERQPIPDPSDAHYYTYIRQGLDVTAPAGPQSDSRRRNVLTRADHPVIGALSNSTPSSEHEGKSRFHKLSNRKFPGPWTIYTRVITFWAPGFLLALFGMRDKQVQTAWREKIALVSIILIIMAIIGFLTFGLQQAVCNSLSTKEKNTRLSEIGTGQVVVNGKAYNVSHFTHVPNDEVGDGDLLDKPASVGGMDLSLMFQNPNDNCKNILKYDSNYADSKGNVVSVYPCQMVMVDTTKNDIDPGVKYNSALCHNSARQRRQLDDLPNSPIVYSYENITRKGQNLVIYDGDVLDLNRLDWLLPEVKVHPTMTKIKNGKFQGDDMSMFFAAEAPQVGRCLRDLTKVGSVDTMSGGCMISNIVLYVSLIVILGAVFAKFFMAIYFGWFMSRKLGTSRPETPEERKERLEKIENWAENNNHVGASEDIAPQHSVAAAPIPTRKLRWLPTVSRYSQFEPGDEPASRRAPKRGRNGVNGNQIKSGYLNSLYLNENASSSTAGGQSSFTRNGSNVDLANSSQLEFASYPTGVAPAVSQVNLSQPDSVNESPFDFPLAYTLLLVTCYSEGSHGIRTTLDSLAGTDYPGSHKCIFVICDGLIKGAGEDMYTPDVCLSMMKDFVIPPDRVQPYTYLAIASGAKRRNMAKIYAGYYAPGENSPEETKSEPVPMVLVVKCGTPEEADEKKPGNRGKRDSQVLLMRFLQHVMFDDRMTEMEYELFNAMWNVTKVTPDNFEICLMVDADTKVYVDSVTRMVSTMVKDPQVMGLCGETKISNKRDSWVTAIQVFEYYISHHQAKAFESVFGGVTCLPGCFCMYRIKAPKGSNNYWVPVLANPNIVENYSEFVVDTLHKKNLLLLGEDRYLSTLMLRTFPKRKMMFVPSAVCKTVVPDEFKVLLSQRRRWINSTVHNLMELVLVKDLCGTFCFSMQFVIFMELIGTVALPAAISFTLYIVIISTYTRPVPWMPLMLLACILLLPAVLIGLTTRKMVYVGWMFIYLLALPVWNFVLPTYAYWHFDDFSWGETRKVTGEGKDTGHGDGEGEFDSSMIVMKRWCDFEAEKRRKARGIFNETPDLKDVAIGISSGQHTPVHSKSAHQWPNVNDMPMPVPMPRSNNGSEDPSVPSTSSSNHGMTRQNSSHHLALLQQAAAAADAAEMGSEAGRLSVATDNLERLGYMTPNIIPAIALGTQPSMLTESTSRQASPGPSSSRRNVSFHSAPGSPAHQKARSQR